MNNTIQSDLIRGHINTIILKTLYEGDRYGYDIVKEIEQKSSGQYKLKQPTLYSSLKRLEVQGFIKSYWGAKSNGGRRKYYTLTDMGKELFIKNQSEWEYSRSVIDKLISDKEYDFSSVTYEQADLPSPIDDEDMLEEEFAEQDEENEEEVDITEGDSDYEDVSEEESLSEESTENQAEEAAQEESDASDIIGEIFMREYADVDKSYSGNLSEESFEPGEVIPDSSNYFRDFYDYDDQDDYSDEPEQNQEGEESVQSLFSPQSPQEEVVQPPLSEKAEQPNQNEALRQRREPDAVFLDPNDRPAPPPEQNEVKDPNPEESDGFDTYKVPHDGKDDAITYIAREYKNILSDLVDLDSVKFDQSEENPISNEPTHGQPIALTYEEDQPRQQPAQQQEPAPAIIPIKTRVFQKLENDVREFDSTIKVRRHESGASNEYESTHYYYSNKLMLYQYGLLFGLMMLEIIVSFLFLKVGLKVSTTYDLQIYVGAVIISAIFPLVAVCLNLSNPNKKKRVNYNFKNSMIFRIVLMLDFFIIIYLLNMCFGMPITASRDYITSLVLPAVLCINFPISTLIFNALYKSGKYAA